MPFRSNVHMAAIPSRSTAGLSSGERIQPREAVNIGYQVPAAGLRQKTVRVNEVP